VERIEIVVDETEVDLISDLLWSSGVMAIEERAEGPGTLRLLTGIEQSQLGELLSTIDGRWGVKHYPSDPAAYADAWKPYARATRIGESLVLQPPWAPDIARAGDRVLSIDPGEAWGHGAHPSTRLLAAELVARADVRGARVLDLGCGSGVLSLVAVAYGAESVVALDIEVAAVEASMANAAVNGLDDRILCSTEPLSQVEGSFDIILANIGLATCNSFAHEFAERRREHGWIGISGLLNEQVDEAVAHFETQGLREELRRSESGWSAIVFK